jgi:ATP-dependent DNA helicase PIF1
MCSTEEEVREFIFARAVLAPLNEDVDKINDIANARIRTATNANVVGLLSVDPVLEHEQAAYYPTEFLNSLEFSGLPPHKLKLQEGAPVILLRNLSNGLANGTRLIVKKIGTTLLEAVVATGPLKNETVFLPRLSITPSDRDVVPFTLRRRQFPVKPAWAMTINKAQGQTLKRVGIDLCTDVFGHGQLYVALSRCGSEDGIFVMTLGVNAAEPLGGLKIKNVVYKEVLLPRG